MSFEIILIASLVIFLNIMDSGTTALCFRQYPDKELKGEANPIMRRLMLKSRVGAEAVKHSFILGFTIYCVISHDIVTLKWFVILLGLVVINNSSILLARYISKRKITSPISKLCNLLHAPHSFGYLVALNIMIGIAFLITRFIWI